MNRLLMLPLSLALLAAGCSLFSGDDPDKEPLPLMPLAEGDTLTYIRFYDNPETPPDTFDLHVTIDSMFHSFEHKTTRFFALREIESDGSERYPLFFLRITDSGLESAVGYGRRPLFSTFNEVLFQYPILSSDYTGYSSGIQYGDTPYTVTITDTTLMYRDRSILVHRYHVDYPIRDYDYYFTPGIGLIRLDYPLEPVSQPQPTRLELLRRTS
jgi:hypothetical protein